jgi:hypothetical protein
MLDSANSSRSSPRLTMIVSTSQVTASARSGTPRGDIRSSANSERSPAASADR